ncbi:NB-ARC domain-containing protein [Nocardiopsis kunsanensis]|uniref:NB-ARC domain-containing protein n=1 Tax=Nocardiopsis kunsanensis TaxID=141693 RepID=UPI0003478BBF|nr:NB-ARC domain-containing protein [Nocardiopsis kunsanensis]
MSADPSRTGSTSNTIGGDVNGGQFVMAERMRDVHHHYYGEPPVQSPSQSPMQVEAPPSDFVNHDETLAWIRQNLDPDGPPVVVICSGTRGIGKSALLCQAAYAMEEYFTGGQLTFEYARGAREDSDAALQQFLRALGVHRDALPDDPRTWSGEYRTRTRDKRMLVVVEGAWEPAQVRGLIPTGRGSLVLVSGDGPDLGELELHPGARVRDLEPLDPRAAHDLLQNRARRNLDSEDRASLDELTGVCGGLPLALVLVGAQLCREGQGSARSLAAKVRGTQGALKAIGDKGNNLDVLFRTTYQDLSPDAAALYRALGSWPGPHCDASAVRAVTSDGAVTELVTANLVESDSAGSLRFRHDLLRTHAGERARAEDGAADRTRTLTRMLDAYLVVLGFAERAARGERLRIVDLDTLLADAEDPFGGDRDAARQWLTRERPTLLAVVLHSADLGLYEHAWKLAELSTSLYLDQRYLHDWRSSGEAGTDAARLAGNAAAEARLASLVSRPLTDLGLAESAAERIERAVDLVEQVGDALLSGSVWEFYGRHLEARDLPAAIAAYDRSVRYNEDSDDPSAVRGAALSVLFRGAARSRAGEHEAAVADLRGARARLLGLPEGPDRRMAARACAALGRAQAEAGEPDSALWTLRTAESELAEGGWHYYRAEACEQLAGVLEELQQHEEACHRLQEAEQIYRTLGSPRSREVMDRLRTWGRSGGR